MTNPASALAANSSEARRFLSILDESAEAFCFRVFDDNEARKDPHLAAKLAGPLESVWSALVAKQAQGCGVYVVANAGEQTNDTIYKVRAVFADTDGADLEPILGCGLEPHIVVESSPGKWHVYWLVDGLPLQAFRDIQRAIAHRFGTDKSVNDLARVMRLPGLMHLKGKPFLVRIIHESGALPYSADTIIEHFGGDIPTGASPELGQAVKSERHADVLKCTLLLAASVRAGALTREEALGTMRQRRDEGRWSRHVPDDEIIRALDGALGKGGAAHTPAEPEAQALDLTDALLSASVPFTDEERARAALPHPHAFMDAKGKRGLFPVGEVTVLAAPGREGKTTVVATLAKHYGLGWSLADMAPAEIGAVLIYSAEDDREQYCRKLEAQCAKLSPADAARLNANVLVPELHGAALSAYREIVRVEARNPVRGAIVEHLAEAIKRLRERECPVGLVIFETASTLSDAEEDNVGLRVLVSSLKHVAKIAGVAVVLTHHTSQESAKTLPTLDLAETAFRGGTALVNNARQTLLAVNLGSAFDPFPDTDARSLLRAMVAPGERERVTLVACLSSSKSADPAPVFFRWEDVDPYGPRAIELEAPTQMRGKSWRGIHKMLSGARVEAAADRKAEKGQASVRLVVRAVVEITEAGEQATASKISAKCAHNPGWAKPYLDMAVELGELVRSTEQVPRVRGFTDVYRASSGQLPWQSGDDSLSNSSAPWSKSRSDDK